MNDTYTGTIIYQSWSSFLGLPTSLLLVIATITVAMGSFAFLYRLTGSFALSILPTAPIFFVSETVFHTFPVWVVVMVFFFVTLNILYYLYGSVPSEPVLDTAGNQQGASTWDIYGQQLKAAYSAKFGATNTGFNEEVNARIAIMNNNGRGFTRSLAYDWLKRMHKFTEAK